MQKPNNFDNVSTSGDFTPIILGGHHLVIKKVEETKNRNGGDMIIVAFDMANGDVQPNYFTDMFAKDIRPDKKWPIAGRQYINVNDPDGNCSKSFKSFITCVERSNNGFVTAWNDKFSDQFKGKKIGGVFGVVEEEYNGKVSQRHRLRWFCADDAVATAKIPDPRLLPNTNKTVAAPSINSFVNVPDGAEEEIPF